MSEKDKYNTTHKMADILRCITEDMSQSSTIADSLGLARSTAHQLLKNLQSAGFVVQDPVSLQYDVGPLIHQLTDFAIRHHQILSFCAQHEMEELRKTTEETVCLVIRVGLERLMLEELPSLKTLKYSTGKGSTIPIYAGSSGKSLLAQMPLEEMMQILDSIRLNKLGPNTITDQRELVKELEKVRQQGYSISYSEVEFGAVSVAVPVREYSQLVSLCVVGPETRLTNQIEDILKETKRAALAIEQRLRKHKLNK